MGNHFTIIPMKIMFASNKNISKWLKKCDHLWKPIPGTERRDT